MFSQFLKLITFSLAGVATVKCMDSFSREKALSTVMGSLMLIFENSIAVTVLFTFGVVSSGETNHVQVGLEIGWNKNQIGCCHFVAEIWCFADLFYPYGLL